MNSTKVIVGILTIILIFYWFLTERAFEPLVALLISVEGFLIWIGSRNEKHAPFANLIAIIIFIGGLLFITQRNQNQETLELPLSSTLKIDDPAVNSSSSDTALEAIPVTQAIPTASTEPLPSFTPTRPPNNTPTTISVLKPEPTHTFTATPPKIHTPIPTRQPILGVPISKGRIDRLLPEVSGIDLDRQRSLSNEDLSSLRNDPSTYYMLLKDWKGIGGYERLYTSEDLCDPRRPIQLIFVQLFLFETEQGAISAFDWEFSAAEEYSKQFSALAHDITSVEIGSRGFELWGSAHICLELGQSVRKRIIFQRYNAVGIIEVVGPGIPDTDSINYTTNRLSQRFDLRLLAEGEP